MYVIEQPIPSALAADSAANDGKPVGAYVLKMKDYVEQLEYLGYVLPQDLSVALILNGLTSGFASFKANKKSQKAKGKGKGKGKGKYKSHIPKPKNPKPSAKENLTKNDSCHYYKEVGHWKRNCLVYLAELMKNKKQVGIVSSSDDYSRYGYIYLLKHKHEVFEKFKVFKNEVENKLEKTIKELRSDRGGEYISQEFKDYLKDYGIVQQLTPPYTSQPNEVFERRNHTLLDMVRSMMNLTTFPLSFWDHALESDARILNMVPTEKVDKTPYELWNEKVSNFCLT
nr:retrotransposon protein, putative, Ty1-copia subclass [Tanacetum cinerariifolium]